MKEVLIAVAVLLGLVVTAVIVLLGYIWWLIADYTKGAKQDAED